MSNSGLYANGKPYELPADWTPLSETVLNGALEHAREAVTCDDAIDRIARFYNRAGEYDGTSFLDVEPNPPGSVHAADLYAVSRLSIKVTNLQGRLLLDDAQVRTRTEQLLAAIPPELTITDLTAGVLEDMCDLQDHFRSNRQYLWIKILTRPPFRSFRRGVRRVCRSRMLRRHERVRPGAAR